MPGTANIKWIPFPLLGVMGGRKKIQVLLFESQLQRFSSQLSSMTVLNGFCNFAWYRRYISTLVGRVLPSKKRFFRWIWKQETFSFSEHHLVLFLKSPPTLKNKHEGHQYTDCDRKINSLNYLLAAWTTHLIDLEFLWHRWPRISMDPQQDSTDTSLLKNKISVLINYVRLSRNT